MTPTTGTTLRARHERLIGVIDLPVNRHAVGRAYHRPLSRDFAALAVPESPARVHPSVFAANVLQSPGLPLSIPRLNHRTRCSEVPCVNVSGAA